MTFQAGNARLHATPGDILIVPPDTPHKYQRRPRAVGDGLHPRQPEPEFDSSWAHEARFRGGSLAFTGFSRG